LIELPDKVVPNGASPGYVDFGGYLQPALGGRTQRIDRLGNRFKIALTLPPLPAEPLGRIVVSRLIRAKTEGLRVEYPLMGFKPGSPGSPRVNGVGQSGRTLICDGFTPHYAIREGQWFNHEQSDDRLLYNVDAGTIASAAGEAEILISPMLRLEPTDNDVLNFARPVIQGRVLGEEWAWEWSLAHHAQIAFEIEEMV
jgi:hypothetical protein